MNMKDFFVIYGNKENKLSKLGKNVYMKILRERAACEINVSRCTFVKQNNFIQRDNAQRLNRARIV